MLIEKKASSSSEWILRVRASKQKDKFITPVQDYALLFTFSFFKLYDSQQQTIIRHPPCSVKNAGLSGLAWCPMLMKYVTIQKRQQSEIKKLSVKTSSIYSCNVTYYHYELHISWVCKASWLVLDLLFCWLCTIRELSQTRAHFCTSSKSSRTFLYKCKQRW